jgi:hypothetical protein
MMKLIKRLSFICCLLLAQTCAAQWTGVLDVERVEIHGYGVFLVTQITGHSTINCAPGKTYHYAQFPPVNEKLADRALSSVYYAQSTNRSLRVTISNCDGDYAVATGLWVE